MFGLCTDCQVYILCESSYFTACKCEYVTDVVVVVIVSVTSSGSGERKIQIIS